MKYSFPYEYKYGDWTHVRLVVNGDKAQVFLDYSKEANLSWKLYLKPKEGKVSIRIGGAEAMRVADIIIDKNKTTLINFKAGTRKGIKDLVQSWQISDIFEIKKLDDIANIQNVISERKWGKRSFVEEGTAANIARVRNLYNGTKGKTVFAKIIISSSKDQTKLFRFGYSDRVVALFNGKPIYSGTNKWRSRDYRYLGTVGLFDAIYLDLKKGDNELLMAVSEDFGGWLITGKFNDNSGVKFKY